MEFSIKEIIELLRKRFAFIIISTVLGLSVFYIANQYIIQPSYTASVQLFVNPNTADQAANLNELTYAQKVVTTYINFLQTKVFYQQVLKDTGLNYTEQQIKEMTEITSLGNTEIFQIKVSSYDPEHSFILAKTMEDIAPVMIQGIKEGAKISVVDPAVMPTQPSGPRVLLNTLLGGFVAGFLAVLITFIWEMLDVNVKNEEDLQKKYKQPILGVIPNIYNNRKSRYARVKHLLRRSKYKNNKRIYKELDSDTKFVIIEAYRTLRMNLRYTLYKEGCKKILINSPLPEDGKTTSCANIAITIAQSGARVLLLDCDLRKGRLHSFFHIASEPGISELLSGMKTEAEVIQHTNYDHLHIIAMGATPPNPTELLASTQMEELLRRLEKSYDFIIIDTPPVNVVSDALGPMKLVDGVIMVVKENATSHPNIVKALSMYQFVETKLLGFIINGVSLNQGNKKKSSYYYYQNKND